MDDKQIILLLKNRPSYGLHEAIGKYRAAVQAVVSRVLPYHPQDVEECVADTFVSIWRIIDRIDADTKTFRGLILSTARNTAINRYNQLGRRPVVSLETLELAGEDDIALTVLSAETTKELQDLIVGMGQPDQEIFFRKYFLFESVQDIAAHVGLGEGGVRNRLYRGRQKLRRQLEERGVSYEAI